MILHYQVGYSLMEITLLENNAVLFNFKVAIFISR
jgi:hypothetical protein